MKYFSFIILIISFLFISGNSYADNLPKMNTDIISVSKELMSEKHCIDGYVYLVTYNYLSFGGFRETNIYSIIQVFNRGGTGTIPEECKNKK